MGNKTALAVAAVLLLGVSVVCNDTDDPSYAGWTVDTWSCDAAGDAYGIDGPDRDTLCTLGDLVKDATVYDETKTLMLDCLPGLSVQYRENLLEQAQTVSATELSDLLEQLTADYHVCGET